MFIAQHIIFVPASGLWETEYALLRVCVLNAIVWICRILFLDTREIAKKKKNSETKQENHSYYCMLCTNKVSQLEMNVR